jgi:glycine cleavage system H protein
VRDNGDGTSTIGITDHAQEALGELVYVELPQAGRHVAAGEACVVVESTKAASDVYAPFAGEIVAVNDALSGAPQQVNEAPYESGWLFRIRPQDPSATAALMSAADYDSSAS